MDYSYDKEQHHKSSKPATADSSGDHRGHGSHNQYHHSTPSNSELLSSAKIVANAAKAQFQHDPNYKFDKNEVAGAAENILHAASHYGKLDEKDGAMGKIVGKAENYLHQYHSSHSTTTTTTTKPGKDHSSSTTSTTSTTTETFHAKPGKDHHQGHSGGEYGDYIKMAEGLFNKHSSGGGGGGHEGQSGGKYGEYIKMAEGMLNKHSGSGGSAGEEGGHGHGHSSGSGGYGDYIKMAGGFLKK